MSSETDSLLNKDQKGAKVSVSELGATNDNGEEVPNGITNGDGISIGNGNQHIEVAKWDISRIFKEPTVLGVGMVFVFLGLSSMSFSAKELVLFDKACNTNMIDGKCDSMQNQILVADFMSVRSICTKAISLVGLSMMGKVSDNYGRKPIFMYIGVCQVVMSWGFLLATYFPHNLQFKTLVALFSFGASAGGGPGLLSIVNSYITDITTIETRQASMSFVMSLLFISQTVGQFLGTSVLQYGKTKGLTPEMNNFLPVFGEVIAASFMGLFLLFLPESMNKDAIKAPDPIKWRKPVVSDIRVFSLKMFKSIYDQMSLLRLPDEYIPVTLKHRTKELRASVILLVLINCLLLLADDGLAQVLVQFFIYKFEWDAQILSEYMMVGALTNAGIMAIVFPYVTQSLLPNVFRLSPKDGQIDSIDFVTLFVGMISFMCLFFNIGVLNSTTSLFVLSIVTAYGVTLIPGVNACITKFYPHSKTAEVFMAMSIICNILGMFAPALYLTVYKWTLKLGMPEVVFFLQTSLYAMLIVVLCFIYLFRKG